MNNTTFPYQLEGEEECDETISLTNFPLSPYRLHDVQETKTKLLPSDQSDFFEFFTQLNADIMISHAEDIIYSGKLVPFKFHHHQNPKKESFINHQRSESSPTTTNYKKIISRDSSFDSDSSSDIRKASSAPSSFRFGSKIKNNPKQGWWYSMLFGKLSISREMELRDMKNRQVCRTSSAPIIFPAATNINVVKKERVNRKSNYWGVLLKVLICTDVGYVQTTSLK